ncbi:hypothetical protein [Mechercharimyces sp. CAU 1602]|uniref:hypothetical protein n=1 Tax=Mechercharimyces sp. CAU 1602 TaxID=2973933 RepID=UPI002161A5DF|nr:hypothetical protein [Mechercharimyces sp. CAU 1602]MCS1350485.1 hypothetical protein [Mechercharimyces sp. CAU 1602]
MLFSNLLAATTPLHMHSLHHMHKHGLDHVVIQLPEERYEYAELEEIFAVTKTKPQAFRMPHSLGLGTHHFPLEDWKYWLTTTAPLLDQKSAGIIVHGSTVALGDIFAYLDKRPRQFHALHDYKTQYVERFIEQLLTLQQIAHPLGISLLVENAPMGGSYYFEPGNNAIHPALRTPRHLLRITEATKAKLCFHSAHARVTSHALSYMHRSRSLFGAATEKEILNASRTWIDFYEKVKEKTALVLLSYATSWGDTPETNRIPFPASTYPELLQFAEVVHEQVPIALDLQGNDLYVKQMMDTLRQLKNR